MEAKMPDKYERMAQLRQILRHMFDIGQEFYKEIQILAGQKKELEKSEEKLRGRVAKLMEELKSVRSSLQEELAESKASFEKQLADKEGIIDRLNAQNRRLEEACTRMTDELRKEQFFHANIDKMRLLEKERQEYAQKSAELKEKENELNSRAEDYRRKDEDYKAAVKELERQKNECEAKMKLNIKIKNALDNEKLKLGVMSRQAGRDLTVDPGHLDIPSRTQGHVYGNASGQPQSFQSRAGTDAGERGDLLKEWQREARHAAQPGDDGAGEAAAGGGGSAKGKTRDI